MITQIRKRLAMAAGSRINYGDWSEWVTFAGGLPRDAREQLDEDGTMVRTEGNQQVEYRNVESVRTDPVVPDESDVEAPANPFDGDDTDGSPELG